MIPKWSNHLWWIQIHETIVCQLVFMMTLQKSKIAKIRGPYCRCNFYWGTMRKFPLASPPAMNEDMTALTRTAATMDEENSAPVDLLPPTWMKHCTIAPAQQRPCLTFLYLSYLWWRGGGWGGSWWEVVGTVFFGEGRERESSNRFEALTWGISQENHLHMCLF